MNIILIGPQGSGKGTQAEKIAKAHNMDHFSTGDAFRKEIEKNTPLGQQLREKMDAGELVPEEIVNNVILKEIQAHTKEGIIFDGYPRTKSQAAFLEEHAPIKCIIEIKISDEEAMERVSNRYMCSKCKKGYNIKTLPPQQAGICDIDGAPLIQREDDTPEAVKRRLANYHKKTIPILEYHKEKGTPIHAIEGSQPIEDVFSQIEEKLN